MHISQLRCDFLDFLFMITMSGIRCIFSCKLSLSLVFSWLFQFSITAKCDCITTFKLPIHWIQIWSLFSPTLAIFILCYLTNWKSTSWRDFLPERINPQSTAGDENTSVMSCHSDVLVSISSQVGLCKLNICGSIYTDHRPTLTETPVLLKEILATVRYFSSKDSKFFSLH